MQNKKSASHAEKLGRERVKGAASARVGAKPSRCALLAPRQAPAQPKPNGKGFGRPRLKMQGQLLRSLPPPLAAVARSPLAALPCCPRRFAPRNDKRKNCGTTHRSCHCGEGATRLLVFSILPSFAHIRKQKAPHKSGLLLQRGLFGWSSIKQPSR